MSTPNKAAQRWQSLLDELSPATQARLVGSVTATARDPENYESEEIVSQLSPMTQEAIEEVKPPIEGLPEDRDPMYCLVETPDGEFPSVKMFSSAEQMALRLKELDGEDVVVQMFYGFPIPITKAPNRIVVLPNDSFVCIDPVVRTLPADVMDQEIEVQDDGFLGDEILSMSSKVLADDEISNNQSMRAGDTPDTDEDDETAPVGVSPEVDDDDFNED